MLKVWELEEDKEYMCGRMKYKVSNDRLLFEDEDKDWIRSTNNLKQLKEMEFTEIKEEPTFEKYEKVQVRDSDGDKWVNRYYLETDNDDIYKYKVCSVYDKFTKFECGFSSWKQIRKLGDN